MRTRPPAVVWIAALMACGDSSGPETDRYTFSFDFATQAAGWTAGFADYAVGDADAMGLESGHAPLPAAIDRQGGGFRVAGTNHSDDLFMFLKRHVGGLRPNTRYRADFEVEFATNSPSGCAGIGGAPGESVYVKAGATGLEPQREVATVGGRDYYRMNIDKGNQAEGGAHATVIGHAGNASSECTNPEWQLKVLSSSDALEVTSDAVGGVWLIVGTDSGFEGRTELYFTEIRAELEQR